MAEFIKSTIFLSTDEALRQQLNVLNSFERITGKAYSEEEDEVVMLLNITQKKLEKIIKGYEKG